MAAMVYAGSPVDAYLEEQGLGEMACVDEGEIAEPVIEPEAATEQQPARTSTTTNGDKRHPAHDRLAALLVAHLNSPYAVAVASEHAHYADSPPVEAEGQTANSTQQAQITLSRRGQLILVSLFGTVIAYPGLSASSTNATAATSTWAIVWRMTPPLVILTGVVALWATSHRSTTTTIPRQNEHHQSAADAATRMDRALQDLTKPTIAFVQEWAEWETLAGRVIEVLDTLEQKRSRKQQHRRHASSSKSRRRSDSLDLPEGEDKLYDILCELCAQIEEACSELFLEKYATTKEESQEQQASGIDMQELKLLLEMYVPHAMPTPVLAQEANTTSPRLSHEELIKARRRSWAAFPTATSSYTQQTATSSPITRARSSENHDATSLPGTPVRIRYPTSPIHAHTPRSSSSATPQAYLQNQTTEASGNQGSASKVRGQRKRYSEQFIAGHPSSPSYSSNAAFEVANMGHSPTNPSPLCLAMASASASTQSSQAMQRAATTGSHHLLYDGDNRAEHARSSLDSPRGLLASGRLLSDNMPVKRVQAHHPSSPSLSISASHSISRIKQRPLSTPNGLDLDWRSYQDHSPRHDSRNGQNDLSAHKRHSSSFSATRYPGYSEQLSERKARPSSLYLQASPKLLSPSSRGGRFEVSYSGYEDEEDETVPRPVSYTESRGLEVQDQLCRLDRKRKEILCVILALRAVPGPPASIKEDEKEEQDTAVLIETCHSLGISLSDLSTTLSKSARSLRESCTACFGSSISQILLPKASRATHDKEAREKSYFAGIPGQYPSSPMIEVESASPSPTGSQELHNSSAARRGSTPSRRRHSRSARRARSRSSSSSTSDDHEGNFAPRQAVPLHIREAVAQYKESAEKIEALLADLAMDMHVNKAEMEEWVEEYRGNRTDEDALGEKLKRQEDLRKEAQGLFDHIDDGRLALRRIRDTGRTASHSARTVIKPDALNYTEQDDEEDISADITFSDDFLAKRGSLSSTLSSSANDELIATPPLKPSYGTNSEISLSSSTSSSTGIRDARNTISQLLLDPSNMNAKNMPAFLNFQEKLYEADTSLVGTADGGNVRSNNGKLSREERIALAKAKREAAQERDLRGGEDGQPTATLELVQELKDVVKILRERRAPVMSPEQAEDA